MSSWLLLLLWVCTRLPLFRSHARGVWQATLEDAETKLKTEHAQLVASNLQQNWGTNLELSPSQMADIITEEMTEEGTLDVVEQRVALQKQEKVEHMLDRVENQEAKVGRRHRPLGPTLHAAGEALAHGLPLVIAAHRMRGSVAHPAPGRCRCLTAARSSRALHTRTTPPTADARRQRSGHEAGRGTALLHGGDERGADRHAEDAQEGGSGR